ncbi:MAG: potassium-transporting ATPase subunit C [Gordonia sp. (in: high G+C Gram-positive bacteria)]
MTTILSGLARQAVVAIGVLVALTVILGAAYPAVVWSVSRIDAAQAEGSAITVDGCRLGSPLIGVDPQPRPGEPDRYLHARVSASAPSNLGPNNTDLRFRIEEQRALVAHRDGVAPAAVPADAVTGSASGIDPDISPEYAALQIPRIARENHRSTADVRAIVDEHTSGRQWGYLGEPRVNVLRVNVALGLVPADCR